MRFSHIFMGLGTAGAATIPMSRNVFQNEPEKPRWDEALVERYFLAKIEGQNDAVRRHNSIYFIEQCRSHRTWSGIAIALFGFSLVYHAFSGNWSEAKFCFLFVGGAVLWLQHAGRLQQVFSGVVREIDQRISSDADAQAEFAIQQAHVDREVEVIIARKREENEQQHTELLRSRLQGLHTQVGQCVARGDHVGAGLYRGEIATIESELRSRGS
jgi:hypothetical protein